MQSLTKHHLILRAESSGSWQDITLAWDFATLTPGVSVLVTLHMYNVTLQIEIDPPSSRKWPREVIYLWRFSQFRDISLPESDFIERKSSPILRNSGDPYRRLAFGRIERIRA